MSYCICGELGDNVKEILLELVICVVVAAFLMVFHEFFKAAVYVILRKIEKKETHFKWSIWVFYRYIDPVGLLLAVAGNVPISKPYLFRIQDKKTNRIIGICGFCAILLCFAFSVTMLKFHVFGVNGMKTLEGHGLVIKCITLMLQYMAILSFGMFVANLFPVSVFDMGLLIASFSGRKYLSIIKMDMVIKIIFVLTILIGVIQYGGYRILNIIL